MVFEISFPFLQILVTSFFVGTQKALWLSEFSPRQLNSSSNSFGSSFLMK